MFALPRNRPSNASEVVLIREVFQVMITFVDYSSSSSVGSMKNEPRGGELKKRQAEDTARPVKQDRTLAGRTRPKHN
ncbi:hypothetical protein Ddc_10321 [Ditylenchus destructor]|nr:hypothetical protein Ddc_10321 [Ditylenchus destructor]